MKKLLFTSIMFLAFFCSCKKDKDEATLIGKWTLANVVIKEYDNNVLTDTETEPGEGTTLDFQILGNVVITNGSEVETFPYTLSGSTLSFDGETYQVLDLSKGSTTIYMREDLGAAGAYYEFFANLKR